MRREHIQKLLRHGVAIAGPDPDILSTAAQLEQLGLIRAESAEFVRCSNPEDADFSGTNRHCRGRVFVDGAADDLCCPECERMVYPDEDEKQRFVELRIRVLPSGVCRYVEEDLGRMGFEFRSLADRVYHVPLGPLGVVVCIVDYCSEPRFLTREWASTHPTCYLGVDSRAFDDRFVAEPWLCRMRLTDLLIGEADLGGTLRQLAFSLAPPALQHVSMPVYTRGARPVDLTPRPAPTGQRSFVVEIRTEGVSVEGLLVVPANSGTRFHVFSVLWDRFLADLSEGRPTDRFEAQNVDAMLDALQSRMGRQFVDEVSVRRAVNRLQSDIARNLRRRFGLPISRQDVIQTCRWQGQGTELHGYRLNPHTVMVRPARINQVPTP